MIDDPRFKDQASRVANREAFDEIIEKALQRETAEDWLEVFYAEDIVAGPVNTIDKAIEDPQILHNKMIVSMEHPLGGQIKAVGNPIHMPDSIVDEWVAPPLLGQHNDEILKGLLNYSDEKINALREEEERHKEALMERIYKRR
jgi:formyl-CoA transferase/CoA:oxalate CoA-transferase